MNRWEKYMDGNMYRCYICGCYVNRHDSVGCTRCDAPHCAQCAKKELEQELEHEPVTTVTTIPARSYGDQMRSLAQIDPWKLQDDQHMCTVCDTRIKKWYTVAHVRGPVCMACLRDYFPDA